LARGSGPATARGGERSVDAAVATSSSARSSAPEDAAKADVARRGVDRFALAGGGPEAQAVVRRAQVGAALDNPARDAFVGRRRAARLLAVAGREGVSRPFPDVAGHVVQAVAVGREGADRGRAGVAVEH